MYQPFICNLLTGQEETQSGVVYTYHWLFAHTKSFWSDTHWCGVQLTADQLIAPSGIQQQKQQLRHLNQQQSYNQPESVYVK